MKKISVPLGNGFGKPGRKQPEPRPTAYDDDQNRLNSEPAQYGSIGGLRNSGGPSIAAVSRTLLNKGGNPSSSSQAMADASDLSKPLKKVWMIKEVNKNRGFLPIGGCRIGEMPSFFNTLKYKFTDSEIKQINAISIDFLDRQPTGEGKGYKNLRARRIAVTWDMDSECEEIKKKLVAANAPVLRAEYKCIGYSNCPLKDSVNARNNCPVRIMDLTRASIFQSGIHPDLFAVDDEGTVQQVKSAEVIWNAHLDARESRTNTPFTSMSTEVTKGVKHGHLKNLNHHNTPTKEQIQRVYTTVRTPTYDPRDTELPGEARIADLRAKYPEKFILYQPLKTDRKPFRFAVGIAENSSIDSLIAYGHQNVVWLDSTHSGINTLNRAAATFFGTVDNQLLTADITETTLTECLSAINTAVMDRANQLNRNSRLLSMDAMYTDQDQRGILNGVSQITRANEWKPRAVKAITKLEKESEAGTTLPEALFKENVDRSELRRATDLSPSGDYGVRRLKFFQTIRTLAIDTASTDYNANVIRETMEGYFERNWLDPYWLSSIMDCALPTGATRDGLCNVNNYAENAIGKFKGTFLNNKANSRIDKLVEILCEEYFIHYRLWKSCKTRVSKEERNKLARAYDIWAKGEIFRSNKYSTIYYIKAESASQEVDAAIAVYEVHYPSDQHGRPSCTCPSFQGTGKVCKHWRAVDLFVRNGHFKPEIHALQAGSDSGDEVDPDVDDSEGSDQGTDEEADVSRDHFQYEWDVNEGMGGSYEAGDGADDSCSERSLNTDGGGSRGSFQAVDGVCAVLSDDSDAELLDVHRRGSGREETQMHKDSSDEEVDETGEQRWELGSDEGSDGVLRDNSKSESATFVPRVTGRNLADQSDFRLRAPKPGRPAKMPSTRDYQGKQKQAVTISDAKCCQVQQAEWLVIPQAQEHTESHKKCKCKRPLLRNPQSTRQAHFEDIYNTVSSLKPDADVDIFLKQLRKCSAAPHPEISPQSFRSNPSMANLQMDRSASRHIPSVEQQIWWPILPVQWDRRPMQPLSDILHGRDAFLSTGDGRCLVNAVSTAISGTEGYATELIMRISLELLEHTDAYARVLHILALATVVEREIICIHTGGLKEKFSNVWVQPRVLSGLHSSLGPTIVLLWHNMHFVPLLLTGKEPPALASPPMVMPATDSELEDERTYGQILQETTRWIHGDDFDTDEAKFGILEVLLVKQNGRKIEADRAKLRICEQVQAQPSLRMVPDLLAQQWYPTHSPRKHLIAGASLSAKHILDNRLAIKTRAVGSCGFEAISIAVSGTSNYSNMLRIATAHELITNEDLYVDFALELDKHERVQFLKYFAEDLEESNLESVPNQNVTDRVRRALRRHVIDICQENKEIGLLELKALAGVLGRDIFSIHRNPSDPMNRMLDPIFNGAEGTCSAIVILWVGLGGWTGNDHDARHIVPLIRFGSAPDTASLEADVIQIDSEEGPTATQSAAPSPSISPLKRIKTYVSPQTSKVNNENRPPQTMGTVMGTVLQENNKRKLRAGEPVEVQTKKKPRSSLQQKRPAKGKGRKCGSADVDTTESTSENATHPTQPPTSDALTSDTPPQSSFKEGDRVLVSCEFRDKSGFFPATIHQVPVKGDKFAVRWDQGGRVERGVDRSNITSIGALKPGCRIQVEKGRNVNVEARFMGEMLDEVRSVWRVKVELLNTVNNVPEEDVFAWGDIFVPVLNEEEQQGGVNWDQGKRRMDDDVGEGGGGGSKKGGDDEGGKGAVPVSVGDAITQLKLDVKVLHEINAEARDAGVMPSMLSHLRLPMNAVYKWVFDQVDEADADISKPNLALFATCLVAHLADVDKFDPRGLQLGCRWVEEFDKVAQKKVRVLRTSMDIWVVRRLDLRLQGIEEFPRLLAYAYAIAECLYIPFFRQHDLLKPVRPARDDDADQCALATFSWRDEEELASMIIERLHEFINNLSQDLPTLLIDTAHFRKLIDKHDDDV
ncbi:hypothetical protein HK102_010010 [Quaeritorhiza haematococci]|nr:hypothetical protein HK102_010010 [Quaeritorhiza haematococci]